MLQDKVHVAFRHIILATPEKADSMELEPYFCTWSVVKFSKQQFLIVFGIDGINYFVVNSGLITVRRFTI